MSAEPLACPFCNALFPLPPNAYDGQRVTCGRCGEVFPLRGVGGVQLPPGVALARGQEPTALTLPQSPFLPAVRSRNRLVVGVVLTAMALMAAGGLTFALLTQAKRRANDSGVVPRRKRPIFPEPNDAGFTPYVPAKLPALGYLLPKTNLILGIHVRQMRAGPEVGRKALAEPIKVGKGSIVLRNLLAWTGLEIEELDHVAAGVQTDDVDLPRVIVVVRTSKPIAPRRVIEKLQADKRDGPRKGQEVYRFQIPGLASRSTLWFADETTLVFDLFGQMDDVPETAREGLANLTFATSDALRNRLDSGSVLWCVGTVDDWGSMAKKPWFQAVQTFAGAGAKEWLERLSTLRVLAVGMQFDPDVKAGAEIRCQDAATAEMLRASLVGPNDADVTVHADKEWLSVQWKGSLDAVFKGLGR